MNSRTLGVVAQAALLPALWIGVSSSTVLAGPGDSDQVSIGIRVTPIAMIEFPQGNELWLRVPPDQSTIPSAGVRFLITGNAMATVTAEPDDFAWIQHYIIGGFDEGPRYLGKAIRAGHLDEIGYNLQVEFPVGVYGGGLPPDNPGSTPPLSLDMTSRPGGVAPGYVHMTASHHWTPDGGFPLPGVYSGTVTVTVAAGYIP